MLVLGRDSLIINLPGTLKVPGKWLLQKGSNYENIF